LELERDQGLISNNTQAEWDDQQETERNSPNKPNRSVEETTVAGLVVLDGMPHGETDGKPADEE
jgi:hypothetical protein